MAQPNSISVVLDDVTVAEVKKAIGVFKTRLVPHLKKLSAQDRKELIKLGDKTIEFVRKAYEFTGLHPDLVPGFLDRDEFRIDLEALAALQTIERELASVNAAIEDSIVLCGSEAYQAALLFYGSVKAAKSRNIGDAALVFDELSVRFPGSSVAKAARS